MKTFLIVLLFVASVARTQPLVLDMDVFAERRAKFMQKMEPNGVAIFPSKPEYIRNGSVEYEYRQESNFYYLTGFEDPESILLINPSHPRHKFVLFVRRKDWRREAYDGIRPGIEGAMKLFRADTALYTPNFKEVVTGFLNPGAPLYYPRGINPRIDEWLWESVESRDTNLRVLNPYTLLTEMRLIKTDGDMQMGQQRAIEISALAHIEAMKAIRPGMYEYEIQAVFEYVFRKNGSPRNGYGCIVGSGPNSGILHYRNNSRQMKDGDLVLMDCGAEFGYYSADITRTVPVNGKFTNEQKNIYEIVLNAQKNAIRLVKPGVAMAEINAVLDSLLGQGLHRLGFIKDPKHFRILTIHGYAHWIGLEVHDVGGYMRDGKSIVLEPGMIFTVEPGIYIRADLAERLSQYGYTEEEMSRIRPMLHRYMDIGVRIEDDILVTPDGHKNMSASVPKEIKDVEALMLQARKEKRTP